MSKKEKIERKLRDVIISFEKEFYDIALIELEDDSKLVVKELNKLKK